MIKKHRASKILLFLLILFSFSIEEGEGANTLNTISQTPSSTAPLETTQSIASNNFADHLTKGATISSPEGGATYDSPSGSNSLNLLGHPPELEIGFGIFTLRLKQYRGSNQYATYLWPLPFFIYRGEKVYAKNSMIMGHLYQKDRIQLGMSMMASLRVNNVKNDARQGMPSLDPTIEIGPELTYTLLGENKSNFYEFSFNLPIRQGVAVDFFRAKGIGQFIVPYFSYYIRPQEKSFGFSIEVTSALMFATKEYHNYFYGVPQIYSTKDRPTYEAKAGYSGAHMTTYLSKKWGRIFTYGFFRYDRLDGVSFKDSPLYRDKEYVAMGGGIIWYFYQSSTKAVNKRYE